MVLLKKFATWLQVAGAVVAVTAVSWLAAQYVFHLKLLNVQTGSMRPTFAPGDALVMQRSDSELTVPGGIVSYRSSRDPSELVTHRVVKVWSGSFQTKGDALGTLDPVVKDSLLAGRVVAVLPGLGRVLGWLQSWQGLVACIYLPAAAIAVQELIRLERTFSRRKLYRMREPQVI